MRACAQTLSHVFSYSIFLRSHFVSWKRVLVLTVGAQCFLEKQREPREAEITVYIIVENIHCRNWYFLDDPKQICCIADQAIGSDLPIQ